MIAFMSPQRQAIQKKSQQGKALIKDAITELLNSYGDKWLRRSQIEASNHGNEYRTWTVRCAVGRR